MKSYLCVLFFFGFVKSQASRDYWIGNVDGYDVIPGCRQMTRPVMLLNRGNRQNAQRPTLHQGFQPNFNNQGLQQPTVNTQGINNQGFPQPIPNNQGFQQPNQNNQGFLQRNPNMGFQQQIPNQGFQRPNPNQGFQRIPPDTLNLFNIERPCAVENVDCIRMYLAQKSGCRPVNGAVGTFIMRKESFDAPHSNVSFTVNNAEITGLDTAKIKEFYMNKKTDNLVLEVEFGKVAIYSPKTEIRYYRKGREAMEGEDFTNIEFNKFSLTLVVRHVHDESLTDSHVYAHFSEPVPQFTGGPGLVNIKGITRMDLKWAEEIGLTAREALVKQAPIYLSAYMQSSICDFRP